jgi:MoaA/NifB/PqqE/SkfB family radical SAM enzyme
MDKGYLTLLTGCTNDCVFCTLGKRHFWADYMIEDEEYNIKAKSKELRNVGDVTLSGSDPIEYKNLIPLIKRLKEQGCQSLSIATHGRMLSDKAVTEELTGLGVEWFTISLYGAEAQIHDSVTQVDGSFKETLAGIENVKAAGKKVTMVSQVLVQNKDHLIELARLSAKIPCESLSIHMTYLTHSDDNFYVPTKDLGKYLNPLYELHLKDNIPIFFVEIPYCVFDKIDPQLLLSAQNIYHRENKFEEIGDKSGREIHESKIKLHLKMCHSCAAFDICDGFFKKDVDNFGVGDLKPLPK